MPHAQKIRNHPPALLELDIIRRDKKQEPKPEGGAIPRQLTNLSPRLAKRRRRVAPSIGGQTEPLGKACLSPRPPRQVKQGDEKNR